MICFRYKVVDDREYFIWDCIASLLILIVFILVAGAVYDNTCDGAAYHKTAIGLLKEGWNPFYMSSNYYNYFRQVIVPVRDNPMLWAEAYPKATWYFAAAVYCLTGNIESGKCYTLIFAFITFGTCLECFSKKTEKKGAFILSATAALNPIVCAQFQGYYLDGAVASILTMLIIRFLELLEGVSEGERREKEIAIFALIVWGCNLKFNVAIYIATICAVYCICLSIKNKKIQIKNTVILMGEGILSIFVIGFAPYITNFRRYGNMFYGLTKLLDENTFQEGFGIRGLNVTGRFWASVFGRTSHGQYKSLEELLKIPFTFKKEELTWYSIPDVRVGGFGVLFSGLFLISVIIIITAVIIKIRRKEANIAFAYVFSIFVVSLLEFCFIPQTSQFRYIPHFYLVVVYALYYVIKSKENKSLKKLVLFVYVAAIIFNILPWAGTALVRIKDGVQTTSTLSFMEENCQTGNIRYRVAFSYDDFTGMFFNLKDYNINYVYTDIETINQEYKVTFSNWLHYKEEYY